VADPGARGGLEKVPKDKPGWKKTKNGLVKKEKSFDIWGSCGKKTANGKRRKRTIVKN